MTFCSLLIFFLNLNKWPQYWIIKTATRIAMRYGRSQFEKQKWQMTCLNFFFMKKSNVFWNCFKTKYVTCILEYRELNVNELMKSSKKFSA